MSIFPKRVVNGENVIIHFKIENNEHVKRIFYEIQVIDPIGRIADSFSEQIFSSGIREVYYCHKVGVNEIPGKYHVRTNMYLNGRKFPSYSTSADYFFVDKICARKIKAQIEIVNMSDEETPFQIVRKDGVIRYQSVLSKRKKELVENEEEMVFITYANKYIQKIRFEEERIYYKTNKYRWRIQGNLVQLWNEKNMQTIELDQKQTNVWMKVDGINSVAEIIQESQLKSDKVLRILNEFEEMQVIEEEK